MSAFLSKFPFLSAAFVQAALSLVVALGFSLSAGQTGAIEAVAAAVLALLTAVAAKTVTVPLVVGAITAAGSLLVAFGVPHVSTGTVAAVAALVAAFLGSSMHVAHRVEAVHRTLAIRAGESPGARPRVHP